MYHCSYSQAGSIPIPDGQSNCKVWALLVFLVPGITSNRLCFLGKYLWATIIFKCIYQKWIIGRSCKTKTEKEKQFGISCENELYWFLKLAYNRCFVQRSWRSSKRTPPKDINYTTCVKRKTAMWNNLIGFQLCYCLYIFKRLITLLLGQRLIRLIGAVRAS